MESIVVFDTETTSLEKQFCYNIGYVILDKATLKEIIKRDYVCEQVWHNPMLFSTAYYADKRPIYIDAMRSRKTVMDKFGYICQQMIRDFKAYNVTSAYAYNSPFDEKVFNFNSEWFKCNNPYDNVPIFDIRGYAIKYLVDDEYKAFCEENERFTDSGNYSTTAETMFQYITQNTDFEEAHTALADSEIEAQILREAIRKGAELETSYSVPKSIERVIEKTLTVKERNGNEHTFKCAGYTVYKSKDVIKLK